MMPFFKKQTRELYVNDQVTTKVGYVLGFQNIPHGPSGDRQPVLLQHGLLVVGCLWSIRTEASPCWTNLGYPRKHFLLYCDFLLNLYSQSNPVLIHGVLNVATHNTCEVTCSRFPSCITKSFYII